MVLRILLLLVLTVLVIRAFWRLLEGVVDGARGGSGRGRRAVEGSRMVRDPVCGTFVVQSRALTAARGSQTAFFCSEECRRKWTRD